MPGWEMMGRNHTLPASTKFPFTHSLARFFSRCKLYPNGFVIFDAFGLRRHWLVSSHWKSLHAEHCVTTLVKFQTGTSLQICQTSSV